ALDEVDLKPLLRSNAAPERIAELVRKNVWDKWEGHEINTARFIKPLRTMHAIGGEAKRFPRPDRYAKCCNLGTLASHNHKGCWLNHLRLNTRLIRENACSIRRT